MAVQVRSKSDLINSTTKAVEVPGLSVGSVQAVSGPPQPLRFQVLFTVGSTTVLRWVTLSEAVFSEGPVGPIRALLTLGQYTVKDIYYPDKVSGTDLLIGDTYSYRHDLIRVDFLNGVSVTITGDRNSGNLEFVAF